MTINPVKAALLSASAIALSVSVLSAPVSAQVSDVAPVEQIRSISVVGTERRSRKHRAFLHPTAVGAGMDAGRR